MPVRDCRRLNVKVLFLIFIIVVGFPLLLQEMVSNSAYLPIMYLKKLSFSDQVSSSRKKLLSGFGLGIVMSFIVLSVVLYNASFKAPFLNPVFWNSAGSNSTSSSFLSSWPFSRGIGVSNSNCGSNDSAAILEKWNHSVPRNDTVKGDLLFGNKTSVLSDFEDARIKNVSGNVKDGNVEVKTDGEKGSLIDNSTMPRNGVGKGVELEARTGNSTENVKNVSGNSIVKVVGDVRSTPNVNLTKNEDNGDGRSSVKDCDIFYGRWVRDDSKPHYPPGSCPYIDRDFDCHLNGRPDNEYVKWRWQPFGCDIPRFNSTDFLERLRGKMLVFVGDSLNRNMWESLVCMLRHGVPNKKRVYEISGRHEFKKKGFYAFRFEDYNCSVDFVSSPFLVKESSFKGKNGSFETLRLDLMDATTSMYHDADILVFNTGHWWTHEKTARGEDYYQEGNVVHPRLKVLEAFKRALYTWAKWIDKNIDRTKTQVIYRGYSVTHFRGGPWNSGGQCNKETEPIFNGTHLAKYPSKMKILEYILKDMKIPVTYLNISRLTDYRKDGHPSVYRPDYLVQREVHAQDCSHWCLPGVPDTWNELLYVSLLKSGLGSWRN